MRQNEYGKSQLSDVQFLGNPTVLTQGETMGQIVVEILQTGKNLNRKALCSALLRRVKTAGNAEEVKHYQELIGLVLERDA